MHAIFMMKSILNMFKHEQNLNNLYIDPQSSQMSLHPSSIMLNGNTLLWIHSVQTLNIFGL